MSPSASLKVKVTVPPATPCAPLTLHVTVVPTLTMMFSGQVTVVLGIPWAASDFSTAASAVEPGIWTDPGVSSYEYFPAPFWVTVAFPVAPSLNVTVHENVSPCCTGTSLGHLALVTFADEVDRLVSMPCSTCASSTVLAVAPVAVPPLELPQPPAHSAPIAMAPAATASRRLIVVSRSAPIAAPPRNRCLIHSPCAWASDASPDRDELRSGGRHQRLLLQRRLDVVTEREPEFGSCGDDAPQAHLRGHGEQGPDDLVEAGPRGQRRLRSQAVGARCRAGGEQRRQGDQRVRLGVQSGVRWRVLTHAEHRVHEALVVEGQAAQPLLVFGHLHPSDTARAGAASRGQDEPLPSTADRWRGPDRQRHHVRSPRACDRWTSRATSRCGATGTRAARSP